MESYLTSKIYFIVNYYKELEDGGYEKVRSVNEIVSRKNFLKSVQERIDSGVNVETELVSEMPQKI